MIRLGDALVVVTPTRCTSGGRRETTWATRFCTSTCALSASVPSRKVTVSVITPSAVDWDDWYSMPSTPLIACSRGAATVSAITDGSAPA